MLGRLLQIRSQILFCPPIFFIAYVMNAAIETRIYVDQERLHILQIFQFNHLGESFPVINLYVRTMFPVHVQ